MVCPSGTPRSSRTGLRAGAHPRVPDSCHETAPSLHDTCRPRPVVLDGGLATLLEGHGHDLSSHLWSARLLRDDPAPSSARTGSSSRRAPRSRPRRPTRCRSRASAPTGVGPRRGRAAAAPQRRAGRRRARRGRARRLGGRVRGTVRRGAGRRLRVPRRLRPRRRRAPGVPPAAPRRPRLHRRRGADVLAMETVPCLAEVEALLAELDGTGVPAWLSLSAAGGGPARASRSRRRSRWPPTSPRSSRSASTARRPPTPARPSPWPERAGPPWSTPTPGRPGTPSRGRGRGARPSTPATSAWVAAGARLVGGCCRVGPEDIASLRATLVR